MLTVKSTPLLAFVKLEAQCTDLCMVGFQPARLNQGRTGQASRGEGPWVVGWQALPLIWGGEEKGATRGRASQREGLCAVGLWALAPGQTPS